MSSNIINNEGAKENSQAVVLSTHKHAGNLIEHISCPTAAALTEHIGRCNREGRKVLPGHPRNLPDNPAKRVDYFLTIDGAKEIIEHSRPDQVISVQCGISMAELRSLLAQHRQWFPVCIPDESISLMEYINDGSSGVLEHGYGEARDLVLGMQVVLGSGELVKCGGKVVKNVTGYDMPKLFSGAHGTLCIPFSAHLRLYALPETSTTLIFLFDSINSAFRTARTICRSGLPLSCLELIHADILNSIPAQLPPPHFEFPSTKGKSALCLRLHGITSVVDELEKEIVELIGRAVPKSKIEANDADGIWQFLSRPYHFNKSTWIELSGQTAVLEQLLESCCPQSDTTWTARPGRNKALIMLNRESNSTQNSLSDLIASITSKVRPMNKSITIAYTDEQYLWRIQKLPDGDLVLNELKHRLKHEFDPNGVLNPLALM